MDELDVDSHELFISKRLIVLNQHVTNELKKIPLFDEKIAYHTHMDNKNQYYPKRDGIGLWVKMLKQKLCEAGVKVLTNEYVQNIEHIQGTINNVLLGKSNKQVSVDHIVWTIPPFLFLKAAQISVDSYVPEVRKVRLFHFIFDRPFTSQLAYIYCYDHTFNSFRITLYPNLSGDSHSHRCTVEVLYSGDCHVTENVIVEELERMNIVSQGEKVLNVYIQDLHAGFPVRTKKSNELMESHTSLIEDRFKNVTMVGRARGRVFFMNDILKNTYSRLKEKGFSL